MPDADPPAPEITRSEAAAILSDELDRGEAYDVAELLRTGNPLGLDVIAELPPTDRVRVGLRCEVERRDERSNVYEVVAGPWDQDIPTRGRLAEMVVRREIPGGDFRVLLRRRGKCLPHFRMTIRAPLTPSSAGGGLTQLDTFRELFALVRDAQGPDRSGELVTAVRQLATTVGQVCERIDEIESREQDRAEAMSEIQAEAVSLATKPDALDASTVFDLVQRFSPILIRLFGGTLNGDPNTTVETVASEVSESDEEFI